MAHARVRCVSCGVCRVAVCVTACAVTVAGEEVILHGVTVNVIRYGNQRIAVQHHYFDAEAVVNLLSTNRAPAPVALPAQPS